MPKNPWRKITNDIATYITWWEVGDRTKMPWPEDPDGGELRLIAALQAVVGICREASDQGASVVSLELILTEMAERLAIPKE